jgi:hypothetical protein
MELASHPTLVRRTARREQQCRPASQAWTASARQTDRARTASRDQRAAARAGRHRGRRAGCAGPQSLNASATRETTSGVPPRDHLTGHHSCSRAQRWRPSDDRRIRGIEALADRRLPSLEVRALAHRGWPCRRDPSRSRWRSSSRGGPLRAFAAVAAGLIEPPDLEVAASDLSNTLGTWTSALVSRDHPGHTFFARGPNVSQSRRPAPAWEQQQKRHSARPVASGA